MQGVAIEPALEDLVALSLRLFLPAKCLQGVQTQVRQFTLVIAALGRGIDPAECLFRAVVGDEPFGNSGIEQRVAALGIDRGDEGVDVIVEVGQLRQQPVSLIVVAATLIIGERALAFEDPAAHRGAAFHTQRRGGSLGQAIEHAIAVGFDEREDFGSERCRILIAPPDPQGSEVFAALTEDVAERSAAVVGALVNGFCQAQEQPHLFDREFGRLLGQGPVMPSRS